MLGVKQYINRRRKKTEKRFFFFLILKKFPLIILKPKIHIDFAVREILFWIVDT